MVDCMVLTLLARAREPGSIWPAGVIWASEAVIAEASQGQPRSPARELVEARGPGGTGHLVGRARLSIANHPDALRLLNQLRAMAAQPAADFGEHESIALCRHVHLGHRYVTMDKKALTLAVALLGGQRVAYPFEMADDLHTRGFLSADEAERFRALVAKKDRSIPRL